MALAPLEANAVRRLIDWARGHRLTDAGEVITDESVTRDARLLARSANQAPHAGPRAPEHVTLRWTHPVRERLIWLLNNALVETEREALAVRDVLDLLDRVDRDAARADDAKEALTWAMGRATGRRPLRRDGTEITDQQAAEALQRRAAQKDQAATEAAGREEAS
jgi:hypothetical protein